MAKRRMARKMPKIQPAVLDLQYQIPAAGGANNASDFYIDTMRSLSRVNRRGYEQGKLVGFQGLTYVWRADTLGNLATVEVTVSTAGNTWIVHNAFVKGKALWNQMQDLVLEDNPSLKGKWHDFKVTLSGNMVGNQELDVLDLNGTPFIAGEWNRSTYVMPQHDVDPATGLPLAAEEWTACLIGPDTSSRKSLVNAYQESRAYVQTPSPLIPGGMSTSFFNLLTDSGSQEPELADVIEQENDEPPYDANQYQGGVTNGNVESLVGYSAISAAEVDGRIGPFVAPCGLIRIDIKGYDSSGEPVIPENMPAFDIVLHVAPGMYKGVAALPMGQ